MCQRETDADRLLCPLGHLVVIQSKVFVSFRAVSFDSTSLVYFISLNIIGKSLVVNTETFHDFKYLQQLKTGKMSMWKAV